MATPNANGAGDSTEINDRTFAAYTVIEEHDRLAEALMATVSLIGDVQSGRGTVNVENLSKATACMLYESRRNLTDGLLFAIDDAGPLDEVVLEAIAKSGDDAGEEHARIDAEIKAEVAGL